MQRTNLNLLPKLSRKLMNETETGCTMMLSDEKRNVSGSDKNYINQSSSPLNAANSTKYITSETLIDLPQNEKQASAQIFSILNPPTLRRSEKSTPQHIFTTSIFTHRQG